MRPPFALSFVALCCLLAASAASADDTTEREHVYRLSNGHLYEIKLDVDHEDARFDLFVYHNGREVAHQDAADHIVRLPFECTYSGEHTVRVVARRGHGKYSLVVRDRGHH